MLFRSLVFVASVAGLVTAQTVVTPPLPGATSSDFDGCGNFNAAQQVTTCIKNLGPGPSNKPCGPADYMCQCDFQQSLAQCYSNFCSAGSSAQAQYETARGICVAASAAGGGSTSAGATGTPKSTPAKTTAAAVTATGTGTSTATGSAASSSTTSNSRAAMNGVSFTLIIAPMIFIACLAAL